MWNLQAAVEWSVGSKEMQLALLHSAIASGTAVSSGYSNGRAHI